MLLISNVCRVNVIFMRVCVFFVFVFLIKQIIKQTYSDTQFMFIQRTYKKMKLQALELFLLLTCLEKKNCLNVMLQIIMNLIKDGFDHELLTAQPDFSIKVFIELLNSEYVAIQNLSLDILNVLTQQVRGNPVPKDFQDCGGITKLLSITKVSGPCFYF